MSLAIAIISILAITGIARLFNRAFGYAVCPLCAGVSLTWTSMLALFFLDYTVDTTLLALLMGGSVIGAMEALARRAPPRRRLLFKTVWISAGLAAAYSLLALASGAFALSAAILGVSVLMLFPEKISQKNAAQELEQKLDECC